MAKDYAKQTSIDFERTNIPSGKGGRAKKWLILSVLLALAVGGGYYLYTKVDFQEIEKKAVAKLPLKPKKATNATTFEFYNRLPDDEELSVSKPQATNTKIQPATSNTETNLSQENTELAKQLKTTIASAEKSKPIVKKMAVKSKVTPKAVVKKKYHLQVGSFRHFKDAHRLKASLLLDGFNVSIKPFTNENLTWYRVFVGPYVSLDKAKKIQLSLEEDKYNCLIKQTA